MPLPGETKQKMLRLGRILFPAGIVMLLVGSALQIGSYVTSEGQAAVSMNSGMVWGGIIAALGIVIMVGGQILKMSGAWKHEDEPGPGTDT